MAKLLRLEPAADELDISVTTLRRWWRDGRVRLVKLPAGTLRIPLEELRRIERGEDAA